MPRTLSQNCAFLTKKLAVCDKVSVPGLANLFSQSRTRPSVRPPKCQTGSTRDVTSAVWTSGYFFADHEINYYGREGGRGGAVGIGYGYMIARRSSEQIGKSVIMHGADIATLLQ